MKKIDVNIWNRKELYQHFKSFSDPYFSIVSPVDVSAVFQLFKAQNKPFFPMFLYCCMKAVNDIEAFKYRIVEEEVLVYDTIDVSVTMPRENGSFGFSLVPYTKDLDMFLENYQAEKKRVFTSASLFPPKNTLDCIYCSALPWIDISGHKEPVSGRAESVPKMAFGKYIKKENRVMLNVSVAVNHALVDGADVGQFFERFQYHLNHIKIE